MKARFSLPAALIFAQGEESRCHPEWAGITPKRVIPHPPSEGDSLVRAVAAEEAEVVLTRSDDRQKWP
jgi:hypothetical protein